LSSDEQDYLSTRTVAEAPVDRANVAMQA